MLEDLLGLFYRRVQQHEPGSAGPTGGHEEQPRDFDHEYVYRGAKGGLASTSPPSL